MNDHDLPAAPVAAEGLTRAFGGRTVVGPLDLHLETGQRLALIGANGSGKSTLLRCLAGTVAPTAGTVAICGHRGGSRAAREKLGASFSQERSFHLRLTGAQNLLSFAMLRLPRVRARAAVRALTTELGLAAILERRADQCSTGMLQQLALARALIGEPPVLLLDEPTRSLDDSAAVRLWDALARRPETTVIISTHLDADVDRCDRTLELNG